MNCFKIAVVLTATLFLAACHTGEPTLNATNERTLERTFETVVEALPARERESFVQDFGVVYASAALDHLGPDATQADLRSAMENTPEAVFEAIHERVHGRTASEIRRLAEEKRPALEQRLDGFQ